MLRHLRVVLSCLFVVVFGGLGTSAHAGGSYLWWLNGGYMYGPTWLPYSYNVGDAFTASKPSNCPGPVQEDYYYTGDNGTRYVTPYDTLVGGADINGTTVYLPVRYTGCTDVYGRPIADVHTGKTKWAFTVCHSGYSPGRYYPNWNISCIPDASGAQQADATNEQGKPADCDDCKKELLALIARKAGSNSQIIGDPVNAATGNELLTEVDYEAAGSSLVSFSRFYNSGNGNSDSPFGPGWSHSFRFRALIGDTAGNSVVLVRPDGSTLAFSFDQTAGKYIGPAGDMGKLARTLSSGGSLTSLTYTSVDGTQEQYSTSYGSASWGWPLKLVRRQGGQLSFGAPSRSPSSVSDDRGHTLQFSYVSIAGSARVSKVTLPSGAFITYGYDASGVLTSVTYPDQSQRAYVYAGTAQRPLLTKVIDGLGQTYLTVTYDSQGRATSTKLGSSAELTTFTYGGGSTTVSYALGLTKTMAFSATVKPAAAQTTGVTTLCGPGCVYAQDTFEYDASGNLSAVIDAHGVKTCASFDTARNLPLKAVEGVAAGVNCTDALAAPPAGTRTRTWQWHALFAVPMTVTEPQRKVLFNYDSVGRKLLQTEVETSDLSGALGASAQGVGTARTSSWTYNTQGSVLSFKTPRTDVNATTSYGYDGNQNLVSISSPVGLTTTLGNYDAHGRPGLITYANGLQTTLTYDVRGRTTQVATAGSVTSYAYDAAGLLASATLPSGVSLTFSYDDAHRLVATQDSLGNRVDRTLDAEGNVVQETVTGNGGAIAMSRQAAFDQLSRMTALTRPQ